LIILCPVEISTKSLLVLARCFPKEKFHLFSFSLQKITHSKEHIPDVVLVIPAEANALHVGMTFSHFSVDHSQVLQMGVFLRTINIIK
jgi:hypothetical protein